MNFNWLARYGDRISSKERKKVAHLHVWGIGYVQQNTVMTIGWFEYTSWYEGEPGSRYMTIARSQVQGT